MDGDLQIELVRTEGRPGLAVCGEIDMATAPQLQDALHRLAAATDVPVLDFTGVTFLDSSGIKVLVRASQRADTARITIRNPCDQIVRTLQITGLSELFLETEAAVEPGMSEVPDDVETFLKVLECFSDPDRLIALLDPALTLGDCGECGDGATDFATVVTQIRRMYRPSTRVEVVATDLYGDQMTIGWLTREHTNAIGRCARRTRWHTLTLRDGRIVNIRQCTEMDRARAELQMR